MTSIGNPTRLTGGDDLFDQQASPAALVPDTILGLEGNDTILSATLGGSQLEGNEDNDVLTSRGPEDTLFGGEGNDSLVVNNVSRAIGDEGRDTLTASATASLYGGADTDFILAVSVNNLLLGNQGNDTILGGAQGGDSIYGGKDDDLIGFSTSGSGSNIGVSVQPGIAGINEGRNFISGNLGSDTIVGIGNEESLYGGQEDDSIVGVGSSSFLSGDLGNDTVILENREETQTNPIGEITGIVPITETTLAGGDGDDSLYGAVGGFAEGGNFFDGGAGSDTIRSFAFQDSISGGDGNDLLQTSTSSEVVIVGFGTISSLTLNFAGNSTLDGGEGDDTIQSAFEGDFLFGGGGDDFMSVSEDEGFGGFTLMDGGDGNDTLDGSGFVRTATTSLEVSLFGGAGNDILSGASPDEDEADAQVTNVFAGGEGNDTITLNSTNDVLLTDSANLEGNDSITANYEFTNNEAPEGEVFVLFDTLGDNVINGSLGDDSILAGGGDDVLRGGTQVEITQDNTEVLPLIGAGDDTIFAGGGSDYLFGGQGDDLLAGQDGDDTLQGSFNSNTGTEGFGDTLVGGEGSDTFFYQFEDVVFQSDGNANTVADLIGDFTPGVDRLVFTNSNDAGGFNFNSGGRPNDDEFIVLGRNDNYNFSGQDTDNNIVSARINTGVLIYQPTGADGQAVGLLRYDPDGFGPDPATDVARFSDGPNLSESDFIFI